MTKDEFGARLRELREEKGITQAELAEKAGLAAETVAQLERARYEPSWNSVIALADALGVSTEALRQLPKEIPAKRKPGRPKKTPAESPPEETEPPKKRGK